MRTVLLCTICVILTASAIIYWDTSFSKKQEVPRIVEADRDLSPSFAEAGPLVSIVWYKGMMRTPYKIFSSHREIEDIQYRLQYKSSTVKNNTSEFTQEDRLAFVYYRDRENSFWMIYVPFRIEDNVFCWPYGEDKKIARLLMNKEVWDPSFDSMDPFGVDYLNKQKKIREKLGINTKGEKINQISNPLAMKEHRTPSETSLLETCKLTQQNLREIVSFSWNIEKIDDFLLELKEKELSEKLIHAFAQVPRFIAEDFGTAIKPEFIEKLRQFGKKYDDEGLSREEQIELFQLRKEINKQILDELWRRQDDFDRILRLEPEQKE